MALGTSQWDDDAAASLAPWGKHLALWRVCGKSACRRASACRRDARACFAENFMRLPDLVRDWFVVLMEGRRRDAPFEDTMKLLKGSDVERAFLEWHAASEAMRERAKL